MKDAYLANAIDLIAEHGHMIQGVIGDPPFTYTTGLTTRALPELWLGGLTIEQGGGILNAVADRMRDHGQPPAGTPFEVGYSVDFMLHGPVDPEAAEANMAIYLYEEVTVMQVLWPDGDDRFPNDSEYDHLTYPQRLLPLLTKEN